MGEEQGREDEEEVLGISDLGPQGHEGSFQIRVPGGTPSCCEPDVPSTLPSGALKINSVYWKPCSCFTAGYPVFSSHSERTDSHEPSRRCIQENTWFVHVWQGQLYCPHGTC